MDIYRASILDTDLNVVQRLDCQWKSDFDTSLDAVPASERGITSGITKGGKESGCCRWDICAGTHLLGSSMSAWVTDQGRGGTQACTAGVKGLVLMSCSNSNTCVVDERFPPLCQARIS